MEKTIQTSLTEEKETLLICLRAKALESRSKNSILHDTEADKILHSVGYNFDKIEVFSSFDEDMPNVWRAKHIDDRVREFIVKHPDAVAVYLGCGLDTRIKRINPPETVSWYDVDFPEVIDLRKKFFSQTSNYQMIASSVTESNWLNEIPNNRPTVIIAEGVLEYIEPAEVEKLFRCLIDYFQHGQMIFDVMSKWIVKKARKQMQDNFGTTHQWGVDDLQEISHFSDKLKLLNEISIFESPYRKRLPRRLWKFKLLCCIGSKFPFFRHVMRLLQYEF